MTHNYTEFLQKVDALCSLHGISTDHCDILEVTLLGILGIVPIPDVPKYCKFCLRDQSSLKITYYGFGDSQNRNFVTLFNERYGAGSARILESESDMATVGHPVFGNRSMILHQSILIDSGILLEKVFVDFESYLSKDASHLAKYKKICKERNKTSTHVENNNDLFWYCGMVLLGVSIVSKYWF